MATAMAVFTEKIIRRKWGNELKRKLVVKTLALLLTGVMVMEIPMQSYAAEAAAVGKTMEEVIEAACQGAAAGVEATKDMVPKFGKAAVFAAKAAGVADQGAVAGMYMIQGLKRGICG